MKRILFITFLFLSTSMFAQPYPNLTLDSIVVVSSNDTVYVWDYNAWEQCAFALAYTVEISDSIITILQIDTAAEGTTCYWYHNFVVPVVGLGEGNYRIDIFRDCLYEDIKFIKSFWFGYPISSIDDYIVQPNQFILFNAYPNPFNPTTIISYSIPKYGFVDLAVYNSLGQLVETLVSKNQSEGKYIVEFNADKFSSGIYFYSLHFQDLVETKKILLLK